MSYLVTAIAASPACPFKIISEEHLRKLIKENIVERFRIPGKNKIAYRLSNSES